MPQRRWRGELAERIAQDGPISVADYMQACLHDPEHGYYRRRMAIGGAGDFVTAPEISQVFGELIGLWCAVVWQQMGAPHAVRLIELGPGRGTLMRDTLRAARLVPEFRAALSVELIESNAALAAIQRTTLGGEDDALRWSAELEPGAAPGDRRRQRVPRYAARGAVGVPRRRVAHALRRSRCGRRR